MNKNGEVLTTVAIVAVVVVVVATGVLGMMWGGISQLATGR